VHAFTGVYMHEGTRPMTFEFWKETFLIRITNKPTEPVIVTNVRNKTLKRFLKNVRNHSSENKENR